MSATHGVHSTPAPALYVAIELERKSGVEGKVVSLLFFCFSDSIC
jgi:hypothetical protein